MEPKKIVGSLLLGVLILWAIGWASSRPHKPEAPQVVQASPTDKWHVTEERSPMDDTQTVVLTLDSENVVQGPLGTVKPSLIVRCQQKKTAVYFVTGMAASIEEDVEGGPSDFHKVGLRLDDGPASYGSWGESNDHKALFASDLIYDATGHASAFSGGAIKFAKELAQAGILSFQFTPFDGNTQVARFDLRGLDPHLHKLAETCGWAYE
jgi:type VI secretion system protein VasI